MNWKSPGAAEAPVPALVVAEQRQALKSEGPGPAAVAAEVAAAVARPDEMLARKCCAAPQLEQASMTLPQLTQPTMMLMRPPQLPMLQQSVSLLEVQFPAGKQRMQRLLLQPVCHSNH